jgi:cadmium resistance protein CadD (predicted permease)
MYYAIKIVTPLLLIVAMSWLVFWIDPKELGSNISVAITAMLTLIAYRFSIGELVPKVSYLTRLDYFILGSTLMVFLALLLVIITSNLTKSGQAQLAKSIDKWSRIIFPVMLIIITMIDFL